MTLRLAFTLHFSDLNIASLNEPIWGETLKQIKEAIEAVANYARVFVSTPVMYRPSRRSARIRPLRKNNEALFQLTRCAREHGVTATIENMVNVEFLLGRFPDEIADMRVDGLGFTFDVATQNTADAIDSFLRMP